MQVLRNRDLCPPEITSGDSFRYTHAETMHVSKASTYYDWWLRIVEHRKANDLPPITQAEAESQLCAQLDPNWCEHNDANSRSWVNPRLSWGDIVEGAKAYLRFAVSGFQTVSQEESNRRARICAGCFLLVPIQGCGACSKIASLIVGDVAMKRTDYDETLNAKACAACKCPTKPLVHFPLSLLEQADPGDAHQPAFTEFCWRKKTSVNYQPAAA